MVQKQGKARSGGPRTAMLGGTDPKEEGTSTEAGALAGGLEKPWQATAPRQDDDFPSSSVLAKAAVRYSTHSIYL